MTFIIDFRSDNPTSRLSQETAMLGLMIAIFNSLLKIAKALDLRNNTGHVYKMRIKSHSDRGDSCMLSVSYDGTLFVSTSAWDRTAKLWDTNKEPARMLVFLEEEKAIATGDEDGNIVVWSIEKYLKNDDQDKEKDEAQNGSDGGGAAGQETSYQQSINNVLEP